MSDPPVPGTAKDPSAAKADAPPLERYRRKRNFGRTPEPSAGEAKYRQPGFSFVVQKHAARRLHYDFRLELDGVLKSWALTRGPSLDPADKRLAVHVEDHPLEYGDFEGVIPRGEYGSGTVMIWDRGRWEPEGDPHVDFVRGKLSFRLYGKRLKGRWTLARMGGRAAVEGKENWLLIKSADAAARPSGGDRLIEADARSVVSRRTMRQIAAAADRVWTSEGEGDAARAKALAAARSGSHSIAAPAWPYDPATLGSPAENLPEFVPPALAARVDRPPPGDDWLHEIKFDGYRMQCRIEDGRAELRTRTGLDWTSRFPHIAATAARLPVARAIIDGEVVALLPSGLSSFSGLQEALKNGPADELIFFAFDLLFLAGRDLRKVGLLQRKQMLAALLGEAAEGLVRYSDHQIASGAPFFDSACRMALEGIVSKRVASPYVCGCSGHWLKSKCVERQEFVIGAFTKPSTRVRGIGALLLGCFAEGGGLAYVGRVGTGFTEATSRELRERLEPLRTDRSPFIEVTPAAARREALWVDPRLVCEVEYRGWTHDDRLRHASFRGLREDKPASWVRLESAGAAAPALPPPVPERPARALERVRLTHPDRVLYPQQGLTKRGLAEYYAEVAGWILPHVANRPLSLVRCPAGQAEECFYQKHLGKVRTAGLREVMIRESRGEEAHLVIDDLHGLLALVQMNVLEMHPWGSPADDVERPDRIIFDLDPDPAVDWPAVVEAGFEVRDRLSAIGLASFVKTTGGKGLHVVVPVARKRTWPEVKAFAKAFAEAAVADRPDRYTANVAKSARTGKIFLDYLRNGRGATAIAAYSSRARPGAPVATPLAWEELGATPGPGHFTVESLPRRLAALRSDPWAEMLQLRQALPASAPTSGSRRRRA